MFKATKRTFSFIAVFAALIFSASILAKAGTRVVVGKHKVIYDIVSANWVEKQIESIPNYTNATFKQQVLEKDQWSTRLLVEIDMSPFNSTTPFPIPRGSLRSFFNQYITPEDMIQSSNSSIKAKARQITAGARTVVEATDRISNWVHDHVRYTIPVPQDALNVFRSGRGSCQGYTRLSIALARAVGIPARYAHGYLPPGQNWGSKVKRFGVSTSGGGYHAWIEFYYPDKGWAFTDGEYTKNFVDPYHLLRWLDGEPKTPAPRNRKEILNADDGNTYSRVEDNDTSVALDYYEGTKKDILGLRIRPQQKGAIWGIVRNRNGEIITEGDVVLWKPVGGGRMRGVPEKFTNAGKYSVVGLGNKSYKVTFRAKGYRDMDKTVKGGKGRIIKLDVVMRKK